VCQPSPPTFALPPASRGRFRLHWIGLSIGLSIGFEFRATGLEGFGGRQPPNPEGFGGRQPPNPEGSSTRRGPQPGWGVWGAAAPQPGGVRGVWVWGAAATQPGGVWGAAAPQPGGVLNPEGSSTRVTCQHMAAR